MNGNMIQAPIVLPEGLTALISGALSTKAGIGRNAQSGNALGGDAFAQVFEQLLQGMQEGLGEGTVNAFQKSTKEASVDEQMAAEFFSTMMQNFSHLQNVSPEAAEILQSMRIVSAGSGEQKGSAASLQNTALVLGEQETLANAELPLADGKQAKVQTAERAFALPIEEATFASKEKPQLAVSENAKEFTAFLRANSQLRQAVESVKQQGTLPGKQEKLQSTEEIAGALPQHKVITPFELVEKQISQPKEAPVLEQMQKGIFDQLNLGKTEFVVKLKPEALGEITVKLTESGGKTTLNIVASSQTAKMINQDLAALREVMKPMQVEVHAAVTSTPSSSESTMQHFNMQNQQFQQRNPHFQQSHSGSYTGFHGEETEEFVLETLVNDGLDTYI